MFRKKKTEKQLLGYNSRASQLFWAMLMERCLHCRHIFCFVVFPTKTSVYLGQIPQIISTWQTWEGREWPSDPVQFCSQTCTGQSASAPRTCWGTSWSGRCCSCCFRVARGSSIRLSLVSLQTAARLCSSPGIG